jgi:hypothetical protein
MIVKKVQNAQSQNTLLIVHDDTGNANSLIDILYLFLQDQVIYHQGRTLPEQDLVSRYFLSEVTEGEARSSEVQESEE